MRNRLAAIASIDQLYGYAFVVLAPEIAGALHWSTRDITCIALLRGVGFAVAGGAIGAAVRRGRAGRVAAAGAFGRGGALLVGSVAPVIGLAVYGAASATVTTAHPRLLAPKDREPHRMAGRLGNVAAPLGVGLLATTLGWRGVFVALAGVSGVVALVCRPVPGPDHGPDEVDGVVRDLAAVRGGRVMLHVMAAGGVMEFALHVLLFLHLGRALHVGVADRAWLAAAGEFVGVLTNVGLGERVREVRMRSPQALAVALAAAMVAGVGMAVVAMSVDTATIAIACAAVGAALMSTSIPLLTLATRAVTTGVVRPWLGPAAAGLAVAAVVAAGGSDAVSFAILATLSAVGGAAAIAVVAFRQPDEVAKVTAAALF